MSSIDSAIATLVSRLETVTARLESVEKQLASGGGATAAPAVASAEGSSASVQEYEALIDQYIKNYVELSKKIAPEVAQQAEAVLRAVNAQRDFLKVAASCKKPADDVLQKLLKPTTDAVNETVKIKETNRTSKFPNHLSAISEGIPALGWVLVSPTPGPHVGDMRGGSEFYSNRILKEFKGKDQSQVDWANSFNGFLKDLQAYIKKYHTTGVTWNPRGGDASSVSVQPSASSAPSDDSAPPPPGPPPPPVITESSAPSSGPDMNAVFASLNKGEAVTSGLKKVTADMKTKNRTDKSSVVPATVTPSRSSSSSAAKKSTPAKPPKFSLEGNKWVIEYQLDNKSIVIDNPEPKQTIYVYRCKGSVIQVKGKVNNITLDECTKTAVVFENIVASFEVVNCTSVEVQVTGKVPSFTIDKTSGCQVYLSEQSLDTEIVTSKSSELNVMFPHNNDMVEVAVPEQYKSLVKDGKLVTEIVTHV